MRQETSTPEGLPHPTAWRRPRFANPYVIGAAIGVLSWAAFAVVNQPIGVSTAVSQASGGAAELVVGRQTVLSNPYWAQHVPRWDYGTLFLLGTFIGALAGALTGRGFRLELVPAVWAGRFGRSVPKRMLAAFAGGILTIYGARLAGGCTSGHGISGALQLALSSWVFLVTMFAVGILTAALVFHRRPGEPVPIAERE
jgi:uncharacterized protein